MGSCIGHACAVLDSGTVPQGALIERLSRSIPLPALDAAVDGCLDVHKNAELCRSLGSGEYTAAVARSSSPRVCTLAFLFIRPA